MTLRFYIDQSDLDPNSKTNKLNAYDIETFERWQEGEQVPSYRIKNLAIKFVVDENDKPLSRQAALKIFDALSYSDYQDALVKFSEAIQEAAIPKASGTPFRSPSAATSQDQAASPAGSSPSKQQKNGAARPGKSQENSNPSPPGGGSSGASGETSTPQNG